MAIIAKAKESYEALVENVAAYVVMTQQHRRWERAADGMHDAMLVTAICAAMQAMQDGKNPLLTWNRYSTLASLLSVTEVFYSDVVDRAGKMAAINDDIRAEWDIIDGGKIG